MTHTLKVGIIGYGYSTATFHAPLIRSVSGLELVAVSSSDQAKISAALPEVEYCATPDALFAREDIDLVVIPTPNKTHYPLAVKALEAGKHVVIDKPFTLDAAQARELIDLAQQAGRLLSVFHNRRWDADFLTIKEIVETRKLGRIVHFESHFDRYRPIVPIRWRDSGSPGSGLWYDLGSHLLDQTLCLFGAPRTIALDLGKLRNNALADDWFHAVLDYDRLRVILHASSLVAEPGPRFVLHGVSGSFTKFGLDTQESMLKAGVQPKSEDWGIDRSPGTLTLPEGDELVKRSYRGLRGDYTQYYAGLRDAILDGAPNPVPAADALRVMQLIDLGLTSFAEGRLIKVDFSD